MDKPKIKIGLANDHIGFRLKVKIKSYLRSKGYQVVDFGAKNTKRTHYPIFGHACAADLMQDKSKIHKAIVICGTGVGITNSANKVQGAVAVLCESVTATKHAVLTFNPDIIGLGALVTGEGLAYQIVDAFLETKTLLSPKKATIRSEIATLIEYPNYNDDLFADIIKKWDRGDYHD